MVKVSSSDSSEQYQKRFQYYSQNFESRNKRIPNAFEHHRAHTESERSILFVLQIKRELKAIKLPTTRMPSVYILKFPKFPETFPLYPSLRGARARRTWDVLREIYCIVYKKITYHFSILKVFRKDSTTQSLVIFFHSDYTTTDIRYKTIRKQR